MSGNGASDVVEIDRKEGRVRAKETNAQILGFTSSNGLPLILNKTLEAHHSVGEVGGEFQKWEGRKTCRMCLRNETML